MPASWAKALAPTTALLGWTEMPVMLVSRRLAGVRCSVTTLVENGRMSRRVRSIITNSSREQLPARSPMPLMVHSTWRAPAWTAAIELATDRPRSLWQWTEMIAWSMLGTLSLRYLIMLKYSNGIV